MATIGIIGSGETTPENATELLDMMIDQTGGDTEAAFVFGVSHEWTPVLQEAADYFEDFPSEVVWSQRARKDLDAFPDDLLDAATAVHKAERVGIKVADVLAKRRDEGNEVYLAVAWDHNLAEDEEDEGYRAAEAAHDLGIEVRDLTSGLEIINFLDEEDEEEEPEEAEEKDEAPETDGYTREYLEGLDRADLKKVGIDLGLIEESQRPRTPTLVEMILKHQAAGEEGEEQEETPEEPAEKPAEEEPKEEPEAQDAPEGSETTSTPFDDLNEGIIHYRLDRLGEQFEAIHAELAQMEARLTAAIEANSKPKRQRHTD